jgi:hypothetical protein
MRTVFTLRARGIRADAQLQNQLCISQKSALPGNQFLKAFKKYFMFYAARQPLPTTKRSRSQQRSAYREVPTQFW